MRRWVAVLWHASFSLIAAGLYFAFVMPRWWELMGVTPHTLGTVMRIIAGALIGFAALPVVFTLLRTRRPEFGTPRLALGLRTTSIVLHVVAGVLIVGTAISEIWLSLDAAGPWLFGVYGAAAAIALLAVFAFYLAYLAEQPPPPPKPVKPKSDKPRRTRRGRKKDTTEATEADEAETTDTEADQASEEADEADAEETEAAPQETEEAAEPTAETQTTPAAEDDADDTSEETAKTNGKLRNRRPSGKEQTPRRRRRRLRGGVAVDD